MSSLTTVLDRRDLSAEKTSTCEARLAAAPDLIRLGSFRATAFVKLFIRKKSAPPCPQVLAGGATENILMQHYALKGPNRVLESKKILTPQFFPIKVPVLSMHYQK